MGWDGRDLREINDLTTAEQLKKLAPEAVFSEGEEVTVKGVVFTISLINPPRIVLRAVRTQDLNRSVAAAAIVKDTLARAREKLG